MQKITIKTRKKREVLDITDTVESLLEKNHAQATGICNLFILHTTAALTTADLDPGTDLDMLDAFEAMIPKLRYAQPCPRPRSHPLRSDRNIGSTPIRTRQASPGHLATNRPDRTRRPAPTRFDRNRDHRKLESGCLRSYRRPSVLKCHPERSKIVRAQTILRSRRTHVRSQHQGGPPHRRRLSSVNSTSPLSS